MLNSALVDMVSNICNHEDEDAAKFAQKIRESRNKFYNFDSSIINNMLGKYNFEDDINFDSSGRLDIDHNGTLFQCLYCNGVSNKSLYVSYNGARSAQSIAEDIFYEKPSFPRWSYYNLYDGCFLSIDDPMYKIYNKVPIAWYYGEKQVSFIDGTLKIIKKICNKKK